MTAPSGFRLGIDFGTTHTVASLQRPDGRVAGGLPAQTVLTYPAGWAETQRGVLADAAARAGMGTVSLVAEPLAAAAYFSKTPVPPGSALVVYDFGAGTFDVSVIGREPDGSWRVIANEGLDDVGGLDLDAAIVDHIRTRLAPADPVRWQQLVDATTTDGRRGQWQLLDEARAAKEQLSRTSLAAVRVPGFETDVHVTREEFEAMARPWLERTVAPTVLDQPELVVAEGSLASVPADPVPAPAASPAPAAAVPPPMPVWPVGTLSVVAPPPARRGMRLWPWVLAALVLVGALTAGTVIFVNAAGNRHASSATNRAGANVPRPSATAPAAGPTSAGRHVIYEVTASGSANFGDVTYADESDQLVMRGGIPLPWRIEFDTTLARRSFVINAQRRSGGDNGPVTCRITVDGKVLDETTATGEYARRSASASYR